MIDSSCCCCCYVFTFCPKTHYLSQHFAIYFATLIDLVYLTHCKMCDGLYGFKDTDLASLSEACLALKIDLSMSCAHFKRGLFLMSIAFNFL